MFIKNKWGRVLALLLVALVFLPNFVQAWECYIDPIYERDWWGRYKTAAYVLERECSGTPRLETVPAGTVLHIIAETDGWYKVETNNGNIGWTGARLIELVDEPAVMPTQPSEPVISPEEEVVNTNVSLLEHVKGRLLLQVQQHGEIWYVSPVTGKRYQVTTANALPLFRSLALGITNNDLHNIPKYGEYNHGYHMNLRNRIRGRLLLAVEDQGRVWYVQPDEKWRREVTQSNIMDVFRKHSLGITDENLAKIPVGDVNVSEVADNPEADKVVDDNVVVYDLEDEGIQAPANWQIYNKDGFTFAYPATWYDGVKNIYPNWHYFSEELDYIQNLNTPNYLHVDTYVLVYKVGQQVDSALSDGEALKLGGYYLDGYDIIETDVMIINDLPALREVLFAPKGTTVYGGRVTTENEYIILYTYRNGNTLYRVQYFSAHWNDDYGIELFDQIAKTFHLS